MTNIPAQRWQSDGNNRRAEGPDPVLHPEYYDGITAKRVFAYAIDFLICAALGLAGWFVAAVVGLLSFGLLFAPLIAALALLPVAYHTLMIGSERSATVGMSFVGIRVFKLDGDRPEMLQAFIQSALFFFSISITSFFVLLVCLFNTRRRCLHDMLAGTLVLNDPENRNE